jgi:hypothetical protein
MTKPEMQINTAISVVCVPSVVNSFFMKKSNHVWQGLHGSRPCRLNANGNGDATKTPESTRKPEFANRTEWRGDSKVRVGQRINKMIGIHEGYDGTKNPELTRRPASDNRAKSDQIGPIRSKSGH